MKFTNEGKAAIATILSCMLKADEAFRSLNAEENEACLDLHKEGSSLNHCTRWGLQAADEIWAEIIGSPAEKASGDGKKVTLNVAQKKCLEFYSKGDFAYLAGIEDKAEFTAAVRNCGDVLLLFLIAELASSEACDSIETATQRLESAIEDIKTVWRTLYTLPVSTPRETQKL